VNLLQPGLIPAVKQFLAKTDKIKKKKPVSGKNPGGGFQDSGTAGDGGISPFGDEYP
jgi:hypothetical protein